MLLPNENQAYLVRHALLKLVVEQTLVDLSFSGWSLKQTNRADRQHTEVHREHVLEDYGVRFRRSARGLPDRRSRDGGRGGSRRRRARPHAWWISYSPLWWRTDPAASRLQSPGLSPDTRSPRPESGRPVENRHVCLGQTTGHIYRISTAV